MNMPICPYCNQNAVLYETSERFYHGTDFGPLWACVPCQAWVGLHNDAKRTPLGRLANRELRQAKMLAHEQFDQLWERKVRRDGCTHKEARAAAYQWLASALGIPREQCHIGMFDVDLCLRVVEVCKPFTAKRRAA